MGAAVAVVAPLSAAYNTGLGPSTAFSDSCVLYLSEYRPGPHSYMHYILPKILHPTHIPTPIPTSIHMYMVVYCYIFSYATNKHYIIQDKVWYPTLQASTPLLTFSLFMCSVLLTHLCHCQGNNLTNEEITLNFRPHIRVTNRIAAWYLAFNESKCTICMCISESTNYHKLEFTGRRINFYQNTISHHRRLK